MEVEVFSRMGLVYLGYANECDLKEVGKQGSTENSHIS